MVCQIPKKLNNQDDIVYIIQYFDLLYLLTLIHCLEKEQCEGEGKKLSVLFLNL